MSLTRLPILTYPKKNQRAFCKQLSLAYMAYVETYNCQSAMVELFPYKSRPSDLPTTIVSSCTLLLSVSQCAMLSLVLELLHMLSSLCFINSHSLFTPQSSCHFFGKTSKTFLTRTDPPVIKQHCAPLLHNSQNNFSVIITCIIFN